jgi:PAS domain S-box-containing protein
MITARELMNPITPFLSFDSTVMEAIEFFETHPYQFAAVAASQDRIQGVLTEANLMRIYLRYQNQPGKDALIFYRDCFEPSQLILEGEDFHEVVKKVMTSVGNRVFVIDSSGKLIGHLTPKQVIPILAGKATAKAMQGAAFDELKSQLYLYESFFSKSPFMMHSVNSQGFIQMANEMLHHILGYEYGELIGKTIFDLYPKQNHEKAQAGIQTILSQGYHEVIKAQMVHKQGQIIEVELASRALVDPWKNPIGTMSVSRPLDMRLLLEAF